MADKFDEFRERVRQGHAPSTQLEGSDDRTENWMEETAGYEACKVGSVVDLIFEPAEGIGETLSLAMKFGCTFSKDGTMLSFNHSYVTVAMEGRNLLKVRDMIAAGKAALIRQYDPKCWPEPNAGEPVIYSMEFIHTRQ